MVGNWKQPERTCFSVLTSLEPDATEVWLSNQTFSLMKPKPGRSHYTNRLGATINLFNGTDGNCAFPLFTINWHTPVLDQGPANFSSPPALRVQKVGWEVTGHRAKVFHTLHQQFLVDEYNGWMADGSCTFEHDWHLNEKQSVSNTGEDCPVEPDGTQFDLLAVEKVGNTHKLTVGNIGPPTDEAGRTNTLASWSLDKCASLHHCF
jgi:hypothetical protein